MGKKQKNKKRGVTLTLSEFNEEGGGDPELLSLPSAPKAPEEWEALGGKPEYNLRGYRERTPGGPSRGGLGGRLGGRDYGMQGGQGDDFDDRDWSRRGPLDTEEHEQRGERDWGDMRRGQSMNQQHQEEAERDWNDMRRGPVDSSFGGMSGADGAPGAEQRDWTQRRGPIEPAMDQMQFAQQPEADWSVARGGHVVEAKFDAEGAQIQERDWSQRKGPVEAQQRNVSGAQQHGIAQHDDQDWAAPRKGPVESEFVEADPPVEERDWSERRGPVEAAVPDPGADGAGSGNTASANNQELDWSERRGPVEAVQKPAQHTSPTKHGSSILNPPPFDDDDDDDDQDWAAVRSTATPVAPPSEAATKTTTAAESVSKPARDSAQIAGAGQEENGRSEWTRRGPVQSKAEVQQEQMQRRSEGGGEHRDRGFGGRHRRGGGGSGSFFGRNMSESADSDSIQTGSENQQGSGSGSWRRDAGTGVAPRGGGGRRSKGSFHQNRPTSLGHDGNGGGFAHANGGEQADREPHHHREQERERDWGAARRSMPEGRQARSEAVTATTTTSATNDDDGAGDEQKHDDQRSGPVVGGSGTPPGSANHVEQTMDPANQQAEEQQQGEDGRGSAGGVEDDEWTTVRASTRRDTRLLRMGSAASGRWRGASGGRSGGAGSNGGGFRSSFNSNNMMNQRSFDRSSVGRSGDDSMSRSDSTTSRGSDSRAVFLERKRAGFSHLHSLDADAGADETDGDLADADDAQDDEHAKKSGNGDVGGSMAKMKSGGRFGQTASPETMGGGADTQVQ